MEECVGLNVFIYRRRNRNWIDARCAKMRVHNTFLIEQEPVWRCCVFSAGNEVVPRIAHKAFDH